MADKPIISPAAVNVCGTQTDSELTAINQAVAVFQSDRTKITPDNKTALKTAKIFVHKAIECLKKSNEEFPAAANPDMVERYTKIEAALDRAVKDGVLGAHRKEILREMQVYSQEHKDVAQVVRSACVSQELGR